MLWLTETRGDLMWRSLKVVLGCGSLLTATCSCGLLMMRPPIRISHYCGEGTIAPIKNPVNPGFRVDFESFTLAKSFAAQYSLDCLPKPRWHDLYHAGLIVELAPEEDAEWLPYGTMPAWFTSGSIGTLALRLESKTGHVLFDHRAEVARLGWSRFYEDLPYGRPAPSSAWTCPSDQEDEAYQQPWVLHVVYEPGPKARDRRAQIRFMAGGRE